MEPISLRTPLALLLISLGAIAAVWWWLAIPITLPRAPIDPNAKLLCVSYAPFRDAQTPLVPTTYIAPEQIAEDLAQLAKVTDCVRTYSIENGLDQVPALAAKVGLKVIQGIWLGSNRLKNLAQISTAVRLAKDYPGVITSLVVGNEVLLRGEMTTADLVASIRSVKAQVTVPVTYADVWEFWLRYREVYDAVDFVTIPILPYWEDVPVRAKFAATHVDSIRKRMAVAFPGKEILVGETGWPSQGRMREGALPSRTNQARIVSEILDLANKEGFRVNLIEAYDQPWKRQLEGTVGGHWGLFDGPRRALKFEWGAAVSNHPAWQWQGAGGVALAALVFAAALVGGRRRSLALRTWLGIALSAAGSGTMIGWTIAGIPLESLTTGDWMRSLAWGTVAIAAPVLCAMTVAAGIEVPSFARVLGRRADRVEGWLAISLGLVLVALTLLAVQAALGLVFDPRYRDFPFPALIAAAVPFLVRKTSWPRLRSLHPCAETVAAAILALSAVYIVFNETLANWQALWFAAGVLVLAVSLLPEW